VTLTDRDQAAAGPSDGVNRPDGRSRVDPAHGGPVDQATFPELIGRLVNDLSELADRQIELAKQEVSEAKDQAISAVKKLAIGAGIAAAAGLLLVIWLWTAVIWFFNWLFGFISIGPIRLDFIGWIIGLVVPALVAFFAWKRFIQAGINQAKALMPPLPRTRATLKEDLEWVRDQRTRSTR
jgi:hypothetical protein